MSAISSTACLPSDLSKLNVSQLKAICKERRIVGYSRLGKAALLRKLGEAGPSSLTPSSVQTKLPQTQTEHFSGSSPSQVDDPLAPVMQRPRDTAESSPPSFSSDLVPRTHMLQSFTTSEPISSAQASPRLEESVKPSGSPLNVPVSKRVSREIRQGHDLSGPSAKKRKVGFSLVPAAHAAVRLPGAAVHLPDSPGPSLSGLPSSAVVSQTEEAGRQHDDLTQAVNAPGKRFKPLMITGRPLGILGNEKGAHPSSSLNRSTGVIVQPIPLWYFDFPIRRELPLLSPITIPPPLSQRKFIQRWAIILSGLSGKERLQCCLVSKLIRYAVYASAYHRLSRDFSGRRLSLVFQQCRSALMMNFWPYLRQREQEISERKNAVMSSFLQCVFHGPNDLISTRLWSSPENDKQLTVALRFLLTWLWFVLSTGTECGRSVRQTDWLHEIITDVVEVVEGEIWCVTTRNTISGCPQAFHVLEATCEVLGLAGDTRRDDHLRSDWARYIEQRKTDPNCPSPFRDTMRWADHAEFDRGISRHWLRRTAQMGAHGAALRTIAERYTLACVVGNSLSGRWMSAPEMAQEFAGLAHALLLTRRVVSYADAEIRVLRHHHVESVHLTATGGHPLHPALAVVRTPAREYYILRDNGLEVGCEEEGVASVWMRVLGCDAGGEPVERAPVRLQELKAYIQNV
ncbi:hypothetical protein F5148DRAFT_982317 [Russula earlei]|uniref:Uncharacterized protein n=1 Tax=Russula earlei TaxID=71964 RepID=A0ACC0U6L3_9AGAM|nr:hypothetical protein F5148DRAFT_982317 [Russula earlei]